MGKTFLLFSISLLTLGFLLGGCNQQNNKETPSLTDRPTPEETLKTVIPNEVKEHWKSVEISILDHQISAEKSYTINIGETKLIQDSALSIKVDTFLPAFIINDNQATSASNETRNPAAYIVVKQNEDQLFAGWVFSLYPDAHAFQNPRYDFSLTGYNATE